MAFREGVVGLVGDVRATVQALLPHLKAQRDDKHLRTCVSHYQDARPGLDELASGKPGGRLIPSTSPARSAGLRRTTRCSPAMWACPRCGRRATCG